MCLSYKACTIRCISRMLQQWPNALGNHGIVVLDDVVADLIFSVNV